MTLPVVLNIAKHERRQAQKLIKYIEALDGTKVRTFEFDDPPGMRYPEVANWAFKKVAKAMQGQAFIWIEADVVPLKAGWAEALTEEYVKQGKEYLYAKQFNPPHDRYSGIGVQGPNAYEHAPDNFTTGGFDEYIAVNHHDLVGRTDLIRHSYGTYDANGDATLHEFPRDLGVIGDKAVIFHKDQQLSLIDHLMPDLATPPVVNMSSVGDLGDLVVAMMTLHHRGGLFDIYLRDNGATKGIVRRIDIIRPLLESQPYVNAVRVWKREQIAWVSEDFRKGFHRTDGPLALAHASHALSVGFISTLPQTAVPWLTAVASKESKGRVIVARSARYNNPHFPWAAILKHFGERALFVGTPDEHASLQNGTGCKVEYRPTKNLLEVAELIAGSDLFIGNQSSPMTIAEGLKHPRVQETCLYCPDCVYPPDGKNQYSGDGSVEFEDFRHVFPGFDVKTIDYREVPRKGWLTKYGGITENQSTPQQTAKHLSKRTGLDYDLALTEVLQQALAREPRFFSKNLDVDQFRKVARAHDNAGWWDTPIQRLIRGDAPFYVS